MATPNVPETGINGEPNAINVDPAGSTINSMTGILRRGTLLDKGSLLLRFIVWIFSLLSLIIMSSNKHGDGKNFDQYEEYKYCLAVSILAVLYTTVQMAVKIYQSRKHESILPRNTSIIVDFAGDQVVAYLLISGMSAATPLTDYFRKGSDNLFTDSSAASISMAFFAFLAMAMSALISGYKLSQEILD
ncbi:hypothetical protein LUZ60_011378 [Juncus effusus]|nr:hypothetical protein LUZ60_011378 [Juncus effusus]